MKKVHLYFMLSALLLSQVVFSQGVKISHIPSANDASSILEVESTEKGFLPPRMTGAQRDAIVNPATGLHIYNTETNCDNFFNGTSWMETCGTCVPQPTAANAGADQLQLSGTSATLAANSPAVGTGAWSIVSGSGGSFSDVADPAATFTGSPGVVYTLRWTITTACNSSSDNVDVSFFLCGATALVDSRDGNSYQEVLIGTQCWMKQNLAYLPSVSDINTYSTSTPYYYVQGYNGTSVSAAKATSNYQSYGALYNFTAANNGACPSGWHLPSDAEWQQMEMQLGMSSSDANTSDTYRGTIAPSMKATSGDSPSWNGTNTSGFSGIPGGWYTGSGGFGNFGSSSDFWTTSSSAWRRLAGGPSGVYRGALPTEYGSSVRCVKD